MKQRRNRENGNSRNRSTVCPYCLSSLILDETNKYKCSNDMFNFWKKEINTYLNLSKKKQEEFLTSLDNPDKFLELVNKEVLECEYSESLIKMIKETSIRIPDPLQVSSLERYLKRKLTEEEREEGYTFIKNDKTFCLTFLNYPEEF